MPVDSNLLVFHWGERFVANPISHHHHATGIHPNTLSTRAASSRDIFMTLSAANTEIMDMLAEEYTPQEFDAVAATLGYTEQEIAKYQKKEDTGKISPFENYFRTELLSEIANMVMKHKGTVDEIAILQAADVQLPEYETYYLEEARDVFAQMVEVEKTITSGCIPDNAKWRDLYAGKGGFQRQVYLLSQVQLRLGRLRVEIED